MWHTVVLCVVLMLGLRSALANSWEDCNKGGDRDQVIRACTEIITQGETAPKLALAYNNRCAAYREASYDEEDLEEKALADCDKAIELDPKLPTAYSNRCWVYIGKNELDRALADCDKAIELDPKFASAYAYRCGVVYADKNEDYSRALDDCNKAIELDPRLASAYASRGRIYGEKKDYDRALADDDKAIELDPKSVRAAVTYGNRGWVYAQKGYLDKAIANYDTAIELRPNFAAHYNQRCWFRAIDPHVQQSQLQRALADCNEALRLKHNAFDSRGFVYLKLGEYDRAITDYDANLKIDPKPVDYVGSLYGRGIAKLRKGDTSGGNADIAAAKAIQSDIAEEFAGYGVK